MEYVDTINTTEYFSCFPRVPAQNLVPNPLSFSHFRGQCSEYCFPLLHVSFTNSYDLSLGLAYHVSPPHFGFLLDLLSSTCQEVQRPAYNVTTSSSLHVHTVVIISPEPSSKPLLHLSSPEWYRFAYCPSLIFIPTASSTSPSTRPHCLLLRLASLPT